MGFSVSLITSPFSKGSLHLEGRPPVDLVLTKAPIPAQTTTIQAVLDETQLLHPRPPNAGSAVRTELFCYADRSALSRSIRS